MNNPEIRLIAPKDNQDVKALVQTTLAEFGLVGEGYAGVDAELDNMYASYDNELSAFYVIEQSGEIVGVGGFAPLKGTEPGTIAELRKMYFKHCLRGKGMGNTLIQLCIKEAAERGYESMYLETVQEMKTARSLYQKFGFKYLSEPLGNTGHGNCSVRMLKVLNE